MNLKLTAILISAIVIIASCTSSKKALRTLRYDIDKELSGKKGTYAVAFKDLKTGKEIKVNDKVAFHAASTMKTPVMIEVYKQADEGKFSFMILLN